MKQPLCQNNYPLSTRKIFWEDPYLKIHKTQVSSVNKQEITLESTIFYALSGGQESDCGTIENYPVLNARKEKKQIFYSLPEGHTLHLGDPVTVVIDWPRRYCLMRLHFAAEIVLELLTAKFPNIKKIGAHIGEEKSRIDFDGSTNLTPHLPSIQEAAMKIVHADIPIISQFSDESTERRYWEIPDFARVPCGGTHLHRTSEIGIISLKRDNIGKGKERIVIRVSQ